MKVDNRQMAIAWWPLSTLPLERAPLYSVTSSASPLHCGLCVLSHEDHRSEGSPGQDSEGRGMLCEEVIRDARPWVRG